MNLSRAAELWLYLLPTVCAITIGEILRTPHFMLVSQYKCDTVFEANVHDQRCPQALIIPTTTSSTCQSPVRAHLARDPSKVFPPKAIFIIGLRAHTGVADKTVYFTEDILIVVVGEILGATNHNLPKSTNESMAGYNSRCLDLSSRSRLRYLDEGIYYSDIQFTLFDSPSRTLYVVYNRGIGRHCTMYYVQNLFGSSSNELPHFQTLGSFAIDPANNARFDWSIDPYSDEVYYTTQNEAITLHAAPSSRIMTILKEGTPGKVVHVFNSEKRSHFRVSGGALFSYSFTKDHHLSFIRNLYHKSEYFVRRRGLSDKLFQIQCQHWLDDDYCLLRDGRGADLTKCHDELGEWKRIHGYLDNDATIWTPLTRALIIAIIVMSSVILVLCCCLCWYRHTLNEVYSDYDQMQQHQPIPYYPSNTPGYVDESVDRWNQSNLYPQ